MIKVLKAIKAEMNELNIPYEFDNWESKEKLPFFVGEISEQVNPNEDGKRTFDFTLTGEDVGSYVRLFDYAEKIKSRYNNGKTIENGIKVMYENMFPVPVEDESIKRIQINITIILWEEI